ncbi:hypothetical protein Taro_037319 [Colocasia esculenta]|uniref:CCHC-type domain-containing protein n=1 Tax=Colocasia esculenta TaxID=4460 RepID=A0A843WKG0_COLES|nr:hypothetical protein [Colocasia esculenta]
MAEYEAQFSRLARYAAHLVNTEKMKAMHFLNGLKPQYITQLAPLDIQTYAKMVNKAQLLDDATDFTEHIKGKSVKKEMTSGPSSAKPINGKKRPFNITEGPIQERKSKAIVPNTPVKSNCKHYDKPGHIADECWRKVDACLHYGSREHRILECPLLKENERHPNTYVEMVKKAQLLEDATNFTNCIKGKFVKKEMTSGESSAKPTNGKKRPFKITKGSSQEKKPKVFVPNTPAKSNCKHCDKPGHTADECWRKDDAYETEDELYTQEDGNDQE